MKIHFFGMGYLGHAYSAWCSSIGNDVTTIGEIFDEEKIEPDLKDLIAQQASVGRLKHTARHDYESDKPDIIWVTYDTPIDASGDADTKFVIEKIIEIALGIPKDVLILVSSQMPVGTIAELEVRCPKSKFAYIPENVRVGKSLEYLFHMDRIVLGTRRPEDFEPVNWMVNTGQNRTPIICMAPESAEMVKHTINAFLGTSISFVNEIAEICTAVGANPDEVSAGIRSEYRIGTKLPLKAGGPFKTGHLERDLLFLERIARANHREIPLLKAITETNDRLKILDAAK